MPPRKKVPPTPDPSWTYEQDDPVWDVADILALNEALEATETALQGMSMIKNIDVVLQFDDKVVAAHHDGQKWWVKFGG